MKSRNKTFESTNTNLQVEKTQEPSCMIKENKLSQINQSRCWATNVNLCLQHKPASQSKGKTAITFKDNLP